MRVVAVLLMGMALVACTEVTKFVDADGSSYYYVDCRNTLSLLESCQHAAERTCPNGYHKALQANGDRTEDQQYERCVAANVKRKKSKQPEEPCAHEAQSDVFFACN